MENNQHKGTELNNVQETWNQNEKMLQEGKTAPGVGVTEDAPVSELDQVIKQEAAEYDEANKEERILGGERATVNDDDATSESV